jgi:GNAT superfamily N-acetyltransferase
MELIEIERYDQALSPEIRQRAEHVHDSLITKRFVGHEDGQGVAFIALDFIPDEPLWLYQIFVPKTMRRMHVGTRALLAVEKFAKELGYVAVNLQPKSMDKDFPDEQLLGWYERCGYMKVIGKYASPTLSKSL